MVTTRTSRRGQRAATKRRNYYTTYMKIVSIICVLMVVIICVSLGFREKEYINEMEQVQATAQAETNEVPVITNTTETDTFDATQHIINPNETISGTLTTEEVFALSQNYWYVLRDMTENVGFGIEEIAYLDTLCKEENLNPHIMWCFYDVESEYNSQVDNYSGSSARGLGQILESTAKYLYEEKLGLGDYTHDMAYNVKTNMLLTVTLVMEYIDDGLQYTVEKYSGDTSGTYYNKFMEAAEDHQVDVSVVTYE